MNPDVIVTDELNIEKDMDCLIEAMNSGVNVVATIHAKDINQLRQKAGFDEILLRKIFDRFVVLTNEQGAGSVAYIYDEKLNYLYCKS